MKITCLSLNALDSIEEPTEEKKLKKRARGANKASKRKKQGCAAHTSHPRKKKQDRLDVCLSYDRLFGAWAIFDADYPRSDLE